MGESLAAAPPGGGPEWGSGPGLSGSCAVPRCRGRAGPYGNSCNKFALVRVPSVSSKSFLELARNEKTNYQHSDYVDGFERGLYVSSISSRSC